MPFRALQAIVLLVILAVTASAAGAQAPCLDEQYLADETVGHEQRGNR